LQKYNLFENPKTILAHSPAGSTPLTGSPTVLLSVDGARGGGVGAVRGSFHRDWGRRDSGVKLAHLKAVPKQECTMTPATYEERLLVDVLWSDPVNRPRGRPPSHIPQIMLQAFQGPMPLTIQPRAERRPFDYGPAFLGGGVHCRLGSARLTDQSLS